MRETPGRAAHLTVAVLGVCAAVTAAAAVRAVLALGAHSAGEVAPFLALAVNAVAYVGLGGALVVRRPRLVIPWLLVSLGVCFGLSVLASAPGHGWRYRAGTAVFVAFGALAGLLVQLFPTGAPWSRRWRWLTYALAVSGLALTLGQLVGVKEPDRVSPVSLGIALLVAGYAVGMLGSVPALAVRVLRSRGVERAQLKWFLYSVVLAAVTWFLPFGSALAPIFPLAAIATALFRYRLYDIDRIISRTASYVVVSGLVALAFVTVVALSTRVVPGTSQLPVALATLVAAAVVRPLYHRVQAVVDRRFDRAKYDGERTVREFGVRLEQVVDPTVVREDLRRVVVATVQPSGLALWLRSES